MHGERTSAASLRLTARKLKWAVIISGLIFLVEALGGYFSHSLALLSDAGHVFTDFLALSLAWLANRQALKPATPQMTYGYHRWGILTALINAITLIGVSGAIFYEAYRRWQHPQPVDSGLMLSVAVVGLVANMVVVSWLHGQARENLNIRGALWHAGGDALSSLGVILAGIIIFFTGRFWVDPAISFFIGIIILFGAWRLIHEGVNVLLEAPPKDLDTEEVARAVAQISGVKGVHDLHVWSIAPGFTALSCHLWLDDLPLSQGTKIMARVRNLLAREYHIGHSTLQLECPGCEPGDLFCSLTSEEEEPGEGRPNPEASV